MTEIILDSQLFIQNNITYNTKERLKALHTFKNPKWEEAIKRGKNTWYIEQFIKCFYEDDEFIILPRGKFRWILHLLYKDGIRYNLKDNRRSVPYEFSKFKGELRNYQLKAIENISKKSFGTLVAPCGSGKTVIAIAMIGIRKEKTLVIVHTKELLNQWIERINQFLSIKKEDIGIIGDGKHVIKPVTIGMVQTLIKKDLSEIKKHFGHIIQEECHHTSSTTFTKVINNMDSRYMLGLSATPYRRDKLNKLIFFNVGDIVHEIKESELVDEGVKIKPKLIVKNTKFTYSKDENYSSMISSMVENIDRNKLIIDDVINESKNGICLVLSERKQHINILADMLKTHEIDYAVLTSDIPKKERKRILTSLNISIILATGHLAGEGLDIPKLSRLFIATPISWKGRVKQYIGRILRVCDGKKDAKIYDYIDENIPILKAQFFKRYKNVYSEYVE